MDDNSQTVMEFADMEGISGEYAVSGNKHRLPWEAYIRCFLLVAIIGTVGFITWRPSFGRLSAILSNMSPTYSEHLAWRPEEEPMPELPRPKRIAPPPEWRLGPTYGTVWVPERTPVGGGNTLIAELPSSPWPRLTDNAWSWHNDRVRDKPHEAKTLGEPLQKTISPFRVGNLAAWPKAVETQTPSGFDVNQPLLSGTGLPTLPSLPEPSAAASGQSPAAMREPAAAPNQPASVAAAESFSVPETLSGQTVASASSGPLMAMVGETPSRPQVADGTSSEEPPTAVRDEPAAEPVIDWKTREITEPIPGAFLTIYPKLKFIGLCVPGQGYVRQYHNVGAPAELSGPKMAANDGRVPYGKYYVADRYQDSDGLRLFLSWPSPEDARRIGLDQGRVVEIENAWRRKDLPPQDTAAGGGVGITGLRHWVEVTEGGFTLEVPQMEEVFTALPDNAWVIIEQ